MANSDKDILITPNTGSSTDEPKIDFVGGSASGVSTISAVAYDLEGGTVSFEGTEGQLFSITNNLSSGSIFSVNDISGIPSIDVDADGTIQLAPYGGDVVIGGGTKLYSVGNGGRRETGNTGTNWWKVGQFTGVEQGFRGHLKILGANSFTNNADAAGATYVNIVLENNNEVEGSFYGITAGADTLRSVATDYDITNGTIDVWVRPAGGYSGISVIPFGSSGGWTPLDQNTGSTAVPSGATELPSEYNLTTAGSTRLTIDSSGNIGIGSELPVSNVDVGGTSLFRDQVRSTSQIRATGWYESTTGTTGNDLAFEIGVSGGEAYALSYNRDTASYGAMNLAATSIDLQPQGGGNATVSGNTIWHAGNDGTGSGLDADTVDGLERSSMEIAKARAAGWVPSYTDATESNVVWNYTENAVEIKNSSDNSGGAAYKAMRMKSGDTVRIALQVKGSATSTSGLYVRIYFHNGDLPDGKTHVSNNATYSLVQEDDSGDTTWYENSAISTSYVGFERTYTAPADGYMSVVLLNWTAFTGSLYVLGPDIQFENVSFATTATQVSNTLTRGTYLTGDNYNGSAATTWAVDATDSNTGSTVVARDASGNFIASNITACRFIGDADENLFLGTSSGGTYDPSSASACYNIFMGCAAGSSITEGDYNIFLGRCSGACTSTQSNSIAIGVSAGRANAADNNIYLGKEAGWNSTRGSTTVTGQHNFFAGVGAGGSFTSGYYNVFFGKCAGGHASGNGSYNNFFGLCSGYCNVSGGCNNFLGRYSGLKITTGENNNFLGNNVGYNNTTGCDNNFMGFDAGYCNTTGSYNNFFGNRAGYYNTTGCSNTFIGYQAGYCNTTQNNSIAIGVSAGRNNAADNNIYLGQEAGWNSTRGSTTVTGEHNFFAGVGAGGSTTTGCNNTFIGNCAGVYNTTGSQNNFFGSSAGRCNTTGFYNNFFGIRAGYCNTSGCNNNFFGRCAGHCNTEGSFNNFFGHCVGCNNTTGRYNNFFGSQAGYFNNGCNNNFFGYCAGYFNTTGCSNTFIGFNAGYCNTTQCNSIAIGSSAGRNNRADRNIYLGQEAGWVSSKGATTVTGTDNFFAGKNAGGCNTGGVGNVFIGCRAGSLNLTGNNVIAIGEDAGYRNICSHNIYLGDKAGCAITNSTQNVAIGFYAGYNSTSTGSCNIMLGSLAGCLMSGAGSNNFFVGYRAGANNNGGYDNIFLGRGAGTDNNNGSCGIFIGYYAGRTNTDGDYNTFLGDCAGRNNTTGCSNTFIGLHAGVCNTTQCNSIAIGSSAGRANRADNNIYLGEEAGWNSTRGSTTVTGEHNFFAGVGAGGSTTSGFSNTFIGSNAGRNNTTGKYNIFIGECAGYCNTIGGCNNFFGYEAGKNSTGEAYHNNFFGPAAGFYNTTGCDNNFFGDFAGYNNTIGSYNNFFNYFVGYSNTEGCYNTFMGSNAGFYNTTGCHNTFIGLCVGYCNTTQSNSIAIGASAGRANAAGNNIYLGQEAGWNSTRGATTVTGDHNFFVGVNAGGSTTSGGDNTFFGRCAGACNIDGIHNNFFGCAAGRGNTSGSSNNFLGQGAGRCNSTGGCNNYFGCSAGRCSTGSHNNFFGDCTGRCNTGSHNNFLGNGAGCSTVIWSGSYNTFIGRFAGCTQTGGDSNIAIGNDVRLPSTTGSDQLVIGVGNTHWIDGNASFNVGIGTDNPTTRLEVAGDVTAVDFNSTSDIKLKENIEVITDSTLILKEVKGVKFDWKETKTSSIGVIAQDVEKVLPQLILEKGDKTKTVNYNGLIGVLIEAVKELTARVEELESKQQ